MRILIIGGTGLISTAITRQLLARGDAVVHFNRGQTPPRFEAGRVSVIQGDRKLAGDFEAAVRQAGPFDAVIDMIGFEPGEAESLVRAVRGLSPQVLFCSTVDVYARPVPRFPISEAAPLGGVSDYGKKKVRCEQIVMEAHARGDFAATVIRPAYTYGEGGVILHSLGWGTHQLDRLQRGLPVICHGDGQSIWVSTHVEDVASCFVGALANPRAAGRAYNAVQDEYLTWTQFYEQQAEVLGGPVPQLVHIPSDFLARLADWWVPELNFKFNNFFSNAAARTDLGFMPSIDWRTGFARTLRWLESNGWRQRAEDEPRYERILEAWQGAGDAFRRRLAAPSPGE